MMCVASVLFLALVAHAAGQLVYDPHAPILPPEAVTKTATVTTTVTQVIRQPVTSDVWITSITQQPVLVTHLVTDFAYDPYDYETVTGVVTVTSTPVSVVYHTSYIQPVRTVVSVFTSFVTETVRKDLYHSITHTHRHHDIHTIPEHSVQTLTQRISTTTVRLTTVTVTYTTKGY